MTGIVHIVVLVVLLSRDIIGVHAKGGIRSCPTEHRVVDIMRKERWKTVGHAGVGEGHQCIFPFKYKEHDIFYDCTTLDHSRLWCATEVDGHGYYIKGKWGECPEYHEHQKESIPESPEDCAEVLAVLDKASTSSSSQVFNSASMWRETCSSKQLRQQLTRLQQGCLYVANDVSIVNLFEALDSLPPSTFPSMFENSFFPKDQCPHAAGGKEVTAIGGDTISGCDGGLKGACGNCIKAVNLGRTSGASQVTVFMINGLIGLDSEEELGMRRGSGSRHPKTQAPLRQGKPPEPTDGAIPIPVEFTVCQTTHSKAMSSPSDSQLDAAISALNRIFSGKKPCQGNYYTVHKVDVGLRFYKAGTVRKVDSQCDRCENWWWWNRKKKSGIVYRTGVYPAKDGVVKVLVCEGNGGWYGESVIMSSHRQGYPHRSLWIDWRNLDGPELAHELGHYLGLHHVFGGCGNYDGVTDTAPQKGILYGWQTKPGGCGVQPPVHNVMGYTANQMRCEFTKGQKEKIWATLRNNLKDLLPENHPGRHSRLYEQPLLADIQVPEHQLEGIHVLACGTAAALILVFVGIVTGARRRWQVLEAIPLNEVDSGSGQSSSEPMVAV